MTSIREIARKAGVSPATVSRVLNRDKTFSIKIPLAKRSSILQNPYTMSLSPIALLMAQRETLLYYAR